ncbi:hypothetical protein, variant [Aphanomyces invadans]|uniref:Uncharacterized protein n=1 Tax=Aphanomyces invadans TaxID=157072 RepID=A0A024TBE0_9STRA|nr:hypothetical protein H310_13996 [Aphanomyces invadans]XP_008879908.1 hypothetical protein, variant [Aphanomyces invadans]ETV91455.1 hypothetical protein H310_13996 [Aphanomyces invadans]ETV91456.1 hypothetical protein, variant [Aphanomyces invadans]|eukprot:XP_008879907.1 hypothetical protein H310_13996 [Aphanomyces invadans]
MTTPSAATFLDDEDQRDNKQDSQNRVQARAHLCQMRRGVGWSIVQRHSSDRVGRGHFDRPRYAGRGSTHHGDAARTRFVHADRLDRAQVHAAAPRQCRVRRLAHDRPSLNGARATHFGVVLATRSHVGQRDAPRSGNGRRQR